MIRLITLGLHSQPIASALSGQGMGMGLWGVLGLTQDLSGIGDRRWGNRGQVQPEMGLSGSTTRTEWGSDLGHTPCPKRFLAAQGNRRPYCRSGEYRAQPPVPD